MSVFIILLCPETDERPDDIVGVEYFARRSGLSEKTIRNGKAGTRAVPKARRKPLGWHRKDVDAFVNPPRKVSAAQFAARAAESRGRRRIKAA